MEPATTDLNGVVLQPNGNAFTERERRLLDADFMLSYRPLRNNQFQAITWGTEVLYSDNRYDVDHAGGGLLPTVPWALSACTRISPTSSAGSGRWVSSTTTWKTPGQQRQDLGILAVHHMVP